MNKATREAEIAYCDRMIAECKEHGKFLNQMIFLCNVLPYIGVGIACFVIGFMLGRLVGI
jgi:hypothetical protein